MKSFIWYVLALLLMIPTAQSITLEELCQNDPRFCEKAKGWRGGWKKPSPEVLKAVEEMSNPIIEWSKKYGVDPRAVAGSILAENTMNVGWKDSAQSYLVASESLSPEQVLKMKFSYGPGQINLHAAVQADAHLAREGLREPRELRDIAQRLLTVGGAAEYAAAIVREAQDAYKAKGMDISQSPEILATLYNLGRYEEKAAQSTGKPKPNYFGGWVEQHIKEIEEAIGWSPSRGRFREGRKRFLNEGEMGVLAANVPVQLYSAPTACKARSDERGSSDEMMSYREYPFRNMTGQQVQVMGRGTDCTMRDWSMVKTSSGQVGWIPRDDLEDVMTEHKGEFDMSCSKPESDCLKQVADAYGSAPMAPDPKVPGLLGFPLGKYDANEPADWRVGQHFCPTIEAYQDTKDDILDAPITAESYTRMALPGYSHVPADQLEALKKGLREKIAESEKAFPDPAPNPNDLYRRYSSNPYIHLKDTLTVLLQCQPNTCYSTGLKALETFVARPNSEIKTLSMIAQSRIGIDVRNFTVPSQLPKRSEFGRRDRDRDRDSMSAADRKAQFENYKRRVEANRPRMEQLLKELKEKCEPVLGSNPLASQDLQKIFKDAMDAPNIYHVEPVAGNMSSLGRACRDISWIQESKKSGKKPWEQTGENCILMLGDARGHGQHFTYDLLSKIDLTDKDYADLSALARKSVRDIYAAARNDVAHLANLDQPKEEEKADKEAEDKKRLARCNYDREKTKKAIEALSRISCVQSILVGDSTLLDTAKTSKTSTLVRAPQTAGDRINVTFKGACTPKASARRGSAGWSW